MMMQSALAGIAILLLLNILELKTLAIWLSRLRDRERVEEDGSSRWMWGLSPLLRVEVVCYAVSLKAIWQMNVPPWSWFFAALAIAHCLGWGVHEWYRIFDKPERAANLPTVQAYLWGLTVVTWTTVECVFIVALATKLW